MTGDTRNNSSDNHGSMVKTGAIAALEFIVNRALSIPPAAPSWRRCRARYFISNARNRRWTCSWCCTATVYNWLDTGMAR
jgi:hypothetical protein